MTLLAANNFGDNLPQGQAGPLGLLVVVLLGIGTWLLIRSMNKHLKRVPPSFDDQGTDEKQHRPRRP